MMVAKVGLKEVCAEAAALNWGMMIHWCAVTKGEACHIQLFLASWNANKEVYLQIGCK